MAAYKAARVAVMRVTPLFYALPDQLVKVYPKSGEAKEVADLFRRMQHAGPIHDAHVAVGTGILAVKDGRVRSEEEQMQLVAALNAKVDKFVEEYTPIMAQFTDDPKIARLWGLVCVPAPTESQ